jgi:hypothetical protein
MREVNGGRGEKGERKRNQNGKEVREGDLIFFFSVDHQIATFAV